MAMLNNQRVLVLVLLLSALDVRCVFPRCEEIAGTAASLIEAAWDHPGDPWDLFVKIWTMIPWKSHEKSMKIMENPMKMDDVTGENHELDSTMF